MIDLAFPSSVPVDEGLAKFLVELTSGEPVSIDDISEPPWFEPGIVREIPMEIYFGVLERFGPNWRFGSLFVSGEDFRRLFWREHQTFFGRELTAEESRAFNVLAERFLAGQRKGDPRGCPEVDLSCVRGFRDRSTRRRWPCFRRHGVRDKYAQMGQRHRLGHPGRYESPFPA